MNSIYIIYISSIYECYLGRVTHLFNNQKSGFDNFFTKLKKMKTNNTIELKQEKLIMGQLWDNVRNGSDEEDIGEEVLLKWVFG